jgi:hypothetical protein
VALEAPSGSLDGLAGGATIGGGARYGGSHSELRGARPASGFTKTVTSRTFVSLPRSTSKTLGSDQVAAAPATEV